jgi:hypothetical protein
MNDIYLNENATMMDGALDAHETASLALAL